MLSTMPLTSLRCLSETEGDSGVTTTSNFSDALPALSIRIFIELFVLLILMLSVRKYAVNAYESRYTLRFHGFIGAATIATEL